MTGGLRTFVTPTVIHFTTVLLVAMLYTIPTETSGSLGLLLACCGAAGLGYEGSAVVGLWRHHRAFSVKAADWLWRAGLPASGYLLVLWAGIRLPSVTPQALDILAVAVVAFVLLGIRNTWDLVLWIARQQPSSPLE